MTTTTLAIGQVAKKAGVSNDTIRLYEQYGLIDKPSRSSNGYRQYSPNVVDQIIFIIHTKRIGFTLKEIQELLYIHKTSKKSCEEVQHRAKEKLQDVAEKINELKKLENVLKKLVHDCDQHHPEELCPIFTSLHDDKE